MSHLSTFEKSLRVHLSFVDRSHLCCLALFEIFLSCFPIVLDGNVRPASSILLRILLLSSARKSAGSVVASSRQASTDTVIYIRYLYTTIIIQVFTLPWYNTINPYTSTCTHMYTHTYRYCTTCIIIFLQLYIGNIMHLCPSVGRSVFGDYGMRVCFGSLCVYFIDRCNTIANF